MTIKNAICAATILLGCFSAPLACIEDSFESRLHTMAQEAEESKLVHQLFDLYWEWLMDENPDVAIYLGYSTKQDRWPDLSIEQFAKHHCFAKKFFNILTSIDSDKLDEEDVISSCILRRMLTEELEDYEFRSHYLVLNQMYGIHHRVAMTMDFMRIETMQDCRNILKQLQGIPLLFEQTQILLGKGIESRITPPKITFKNVPKQLLGLIPDLAQNSPLMSPFSHFSDSIPKEVQAEIIQQAEEIYYLQIVPTIKQLHDYLIDIYLPNCRESTAFSDLPQGKEWYASKVRQMTTTDLTPFEIHVIGLEEVDRIYQQLLAVMNSTHFKGDFKAFLSFLQTDPQFFYSSREDLIKGYQTLTQQIEMQLPTLFLKLPKLPFEVTSIPTYAEEAQTAAYYCSGSFAQGRPGYFFVNTGNLETRAKWEMAPLALHEAVPGHHLQLSLAQEMEHLPEFRKNSNFTAYIEGWGLYAESLGTELGLYRDPYAKFGRLSCEMLRAVRLVVDTGMHALGWSREEAIQYFKRYVGLGEHEIATEVDRYLVMPGQALAYKIGELKIQELRHFSMQAQGERFDIRHFHNEWLKHGALPLDIVDALIRKWADQTEVMAR